MTAAKYIALISLVFLCFKPLMASGDTGLPDEITVTEQGVSGVMVSANARFFIEHDQVYSIEQVRRLWPSIPQQQVRDESATLGNGDSVYWVRMDIQTTALSTREWFVGVNNGSIDKVTAYLVTGDRVEAEAGIDASKPFADRAIKNPELYMPVQLAANQQYQIYLRVEHSGFVDSPVVLISRDEMLNHVSKKRFERGIYYGAVLMIVIFNFCLWLSTRQTAYLFYILFTASIGMIVAVVEGVAFQTLWPSAPWVNRYSINALINLPSIFAILFAISFLNLSLHGGRLYVVLMTLLSLNVVSMVVSVFLPFSYAHFLGSIGCLVVFPILLFAGAFSWYKGHFYAKYFTFAWLLLCIMISLISAAAVDFAIVEMNEVWYWLRLGSITEMTLLAFALAARINYIAMVGEAARAESSAKSDFIAHISHELRTPMNGILGMSELLKEQLTDPIQRHYNQVIYQSGQSLLAVINDILDSAKIEANKQDVVYAAFNIRALANEVLFVIEAQALTKGVELQCHVDQRIPVTVVGDAQRIRQVISNLLNNAIRFTDSGTIVLTLTVLEDAIRFTVADTGRGISSKTQQTLFNAFEQGEVDQESEFKGSGLGLYICRRLVRLMGGEIYCQSAEGFGASFWFDLKLQPGLTSAKKNIAAEESQTVMAKLNALHQLRVLVAEDNGVNQLVISKMLEKNGHSASVVENGLNAVNYYREHHGQIDVILMDCEMPVMDGYRAVEKIRGFEQSQGLPRIPIIAFTAHALPEHTERCIACGMDDVMVKPINESVMRKMLSKTQ
ncbi:Sensor histidine kinase RcsC [Sinobacterium norvegicum]|uniref:histidine kinase n=1 Tax=Sinobacterium norvegicum TaxID=1641715 RepID=A0ABN8EHQ4_9GAMM|nr:hybrid sensor histidine kinase/response regulator [Sinobacterium norvegicum]CAH0990867.1 Sensor histidine kinase RcsC [Sinobacterium norvegicum]